MEGYTPHNRISGVTGMAMMFFVTAIWLLSFVPILHIFTNIIGYASIWIWFKMRGASYVRVFAVQGGAATGKISTAAKPAARASSQTQNAARSIQRSNQKASGLENRESSGFMKSPGELTGRLWFQLIMWLIGFIPDIGTFLSAFPVIVYFNIERVRSEDKKLNRQLEVQYRAQIRQKAYTRALSDMETEDALVQQAESVGPRVRQINTSERIQSRMNTGPRIRLSPENTGPRILPRPEKALERQRLAA